MQTIESVSEMRDWTALARERGESIGFVATQGCLHEGHAALLRRARQENDRVVLSVFVNPLQFRSGAYEVYPRRIDDDLRIAEHNGVDAVFIPTVEGVYPAMETLGAIFDLQNGLSGSRDLQDFRIDRVGRDNAMHYVRVPERLVMRMDGKDHPWHFDGVATVVRRLFEIIAPDRAYFGEKDVQQLAILDSMNQWLATGITIVPVHVVRDEDGLSLSSRLTTLDPVQRGIAIRVTQLVQQFAQEAGDGQVNVASLSESLRSRMKTIDTQGHELLLDSIDCVDARSLDAVHRIEAPAVVYIAYLIDGIRLAESRRISTDSRS